MDFTAYFAAAAGASAALMGLLFVALQFNLEKRRSDMRWRPVARATFNIFALLFIISLFELIPFPDLYQSNQAIFLFAPAVGIYRQVRVWYEGRAYFSTNRLVHTFWIVIVPVVLQLLMIYYAVLPPGNPPKLADIQIPGAVILSVLFLSALRNSWDLVLEAGLVETKDGA